MIEQRVTKKELTMRCRELLNKGGVLNNEDMEWLINNVLIHHDEWERKNGCGTVRIEVRGDGYGGRCFWMVRKDGTSTDISTTHAIKCIGKSGDDIVRRKKMDDIRKACRTVVDLTVIADMRRRIELPIICPITGKVILDMKDVNIDHYDMPFDELFKEWVKNKDVDELYRHTLASSYDGSTYTYFDDESIRNDFLEYHNAHTHLRAVSKEANLSILRRL